MLEHPILPNDSYNQTLVSHVHPPDWVNPEPSGRYNLVVIGAGAGGLVSAAGAAGLGGKVALIEKHLLGGDCLNVGCVPSKALIRCAEVMAEIKDAHRFGIDVDLSTVKANFGQVMERMRKIRAQISPHDSAQRFSDLGVEIHLDTDKFTGPDTIEVAGKVLQFKKAIIATGARATRPNIPGLEEIGYLTNESVFSLTEQPQHLIVIGGGPIGCELAQTFRRLGSEVSLIHNGPHILNREDADAAKIVQNRFLSEGIQLILSAQLTHASQDAAGRKVLTYQQDGQEKTVTGDEILVSVGRTPNIENLGLDAVGVKYDRSGVLINDYFQTSNSKIYAVGDVCMALKFTHAADASARAVLRNALFGGHQKLSDLIIPRSTYTDPEIAHVGLTAHEAAEQGIAIETYQKEMPAMDRGITDGVEAGFAKIHLEKGSDKILGATIVGRHAGDMLNEISLAMTYKIGLGKIANVIHPYPTQAEILKHLADMYNRTRLTPLVKNAFNTWLSMTR